MFIDTHCHLNILVKKEFDKILSENDFLHAKSIVEEAVANTVTTIINVGTSLPESINSIELSNRLAPVYAVIGIHPNDITPSWQSDIKELSALLKKPINTKIVGIGECGLDFHYPDYNKQLQGDVFRAQIELALEHNLALVIHTRNAGDETLRTLEEYKNQIPRCVIHCFSEDMHFARTVIEWGFVLGIGGTITYPKNNSLREVVKAIPLTHLVLETDAPFLPIQSMRGKQNNPRFIVAIAQYIAELRNESVHSIAEHTTANARHLFNLSSLSVK